MPHPLGDPADQPLAPHKGLTGAWGAALMAEARRRGAADALLHWPDGTLVETAIASIGLERHGALRVPPAEGRVASLAERLDLPAWAGDRGLSIEVRAFSLADAAEGRLWCFNALRGFWAAGPIMAPCSSGT
jgi:branched-subunit amino acid aminotransferase/4-amino-4-deoxychorismate lyase